MNVHEEDPEKVEFGHHWHACVHAILLSPEPAPFYMHDRLGELSRSRTSTQIGVILFASFLCK